MKLSPKSAEVFNYVTENPHTTVEEMVEALGRAKRSISANVTDLVKKELVTRQKVVFEETNETLNYVELTEKGTNFIPDEE